MAIETRAFRVGEGDSVDVRKLPTLLPPVYRTKKDYKNQLKALRKKLAELQYRLYAENTRSLLVVLQAMDSGGKDGLIRHVFSGVNPQGCSVYSFGKPSEEELQHDYLWRTVARLPERGDIGVFNRSYYEEVLVVRVHPRILETQHLPGEHTGADIWQHRYHAIRDHERHLHKNGTTVVKLFLNISLEEQRRRLLSRIEDPAKNWKFNAGDLDERARWDDYMTAYSEAVSATSTLDSPWYVLPGDDKRNARLYAASVLVETLERMDPRFPAVEAEQMAEIEASKAALTAVPLLTVPEQAAEVRSPAT